jgi:signal transduction histidine kinase
LGVRITPPTRFVWPAPLRVPPSLDVIPRSALVVWTLALVCAAAGSALVVTSDHSTGKVTTLALAVPTGLAFIASGLVARARRPENRTGSLLVAVGFAWFLGALSSANNPVLFTVGILIGAVFIGWLTHLLLAFPTGRLERRTDRVIAAAMYGLVLLFPLLISLFDADTQDQCQGPCPDNLINVADKPGLAGAFVIALWVSAALLGLAVVVRLVQRWRRATPALRRALAPLFATGMAFIVTVVVVGVISAVWEAAAEKIGWLIIVALLCVPLAFLLGLLRSHLGFASRRLLADVRESREPEHVRDALRKALRDPSLELAFQSGSDFVDVEGRPLALPSPGDGRASTALGDATIVHDESLLEQLELLPQVLGAAQIALERGLSLRSLEVSDRRTSALMNAIPDNVYRVRADGTFLDAHMKQNLAVFGGPESFIGRTIAQILPHDIAEALMAALERVLATGEVERVEYELQFEGSTRYIEARIVWSGEDEVVAITRDFTDLKESETALRALVEEQTALRRVATLAAEVGDREKERVFTAVTEEVGGLLGAQSAYTVRFADDATAVDVGGWAGPGIDLIPPGTVVPLDSETPLVMVQRTGAPARLDSYEGVTGELAAQMRGVGWRAAVAAPIYASGRLWGAISAGRTSDEPFLPGAERRIGEFAEIVGIALANAEAREQLASLADEQAALSRVAVAVATAERPESVFDVVTEEVARLLGADGANLVRFDARTEDEGGLIVGRWSEPGIRITPTGARATLHGGALSRVHRTGLPARSKISDPENSPELVERLLELGISSLVVAPIQVSGELWGAVVVSVTGNKEFAPDAEERIGQFARLVAVALASAEAREQLASLAEEQAALGRVAVAVATEHRPEDIFESVTEEVARLFGAHWGSTVRYEDAIDKVVVVGSWHSGEEFELELGARFPLGGGAITRVKETGRPARIRYTLEPDPTEREMVAAPIVVSGRFWGATTVSMPGQTFPVDAEERLGKFTKLVAVALANAEAREQLTASRARIVQAGDAERRRLERNLHDGAQQRLVSLALALRLAQSRLEDDPPAAMELLMRASEELAVGLEELRELARGIHPAILTDRGLAPAVEALAARATVPVELNGLPEERLPEPIEAAAFYVVSESLANVAKYASADRARVDLIRDDGLLVVEVSDDGVGGADATKGSGLRGLADRVEALGGRLQVSSEQGRGTTVRAELPVG